MKRVLFVDDERESLEALKGMLERQELPWEAAFATSGFGDEMDTLRFASLSRDTGPGV